MRSRFSPVAVKITRRLCAVLIFAGAILFCGTGCETGRAPKELTLPEIIIKPADRILILAPHPDDEILGCAGIIQTALKKKLPLKIVFLTYGDGNEWSFVVYRKHPVLSSGSAEEMGNVRHNEAVEAAKTLGVSADSLVFLGDPVERTIKTVKPQVTSLGWVSGDHAMKKWPGGAAIEDPVWTQPLGQSITKNDPGCYTGGGYAYAQVVAAATDALTNTTYCEVQGVKVAENDENFSSASAQHSKTGHLQI